MKHRKLLIISIIAMVGLPLLTNVVLDIIYRAIYGDIIYATAANVISVANGILTTFTMYVTLAILVNSMLRDKIRGYPSTLIFILYIVSLLIVYVSDFIGVKDIYAYFIYMIFVLLGDALILVAAVLACKKTVRKHKISRPSQLSLDGKVISKTNPVLRVLLAMTIVIFAYNFIFQTVETVMLIAENGLPGNSTEVIYLLEPYLSFIIYAVAGYLTMVAISAFWYRKTVTV
jgi:hypothetical protein